MRVQGLGFGIWGAAHAVRQLQGFLGLGDEPRLVRQESLLQVPLLWSCTRPLDYPAVSPVHLQPQWTLSLGRLLGGLVVQPLPHPRSLTPPTCAPVFGATMASVLIPLPRPPGSTL